MGRPALFLDRDGVINVDTGYLHRSEDCRFVDGIFDLVRKANAADMPVLVVTNQAGIGRGYYDEAQFRTFTHWLLGQFEAHGARIDRVYHCPHHPTAAKGDLLRACDCRKPAPGMFLAAQRDFDVDMARSVMVGDSVTDIQAAVAAGIRHCWLLHHGDEDEAGDLVGMAAIARALDDIDPCVALTDGVGNG